MALTRLEITFWDVGQGDCSTISLPDGRIIIIDVGPRNSPLIDWLHDKPRQIHSVILTHNDSDHVGALPALIRDFKNKIENFYMLVDRPTRDRIFDKTFRCALEGEKLGYYRIQRLETGAKIWTDALLSGELVPVFPSMSSNVIAKNPNQTSGILCLNLKGSTQVIWPGDSDLCEIQKRCKNTKPQVLFGPHHGAPNEFARIPDRRTGSQQIAAGISAINSISPKKAFISVGTKNLYSHPKPKYLQLLERAGCCVKCSQITSFCDPNSIRQNKSVMATHLALGLRPPRDGLSCRGAWQIYWNGVSFEDDLFEKEHQKRITALRRPLCLKGRAVFQNNPAKAFRRAIPFFFKP